jgi:predicted ArsR family transcriptional regulator
MSTDLEALSVLAEPQRLRILEHLRTQASPASLSEMVTDLGIGRTLLAFHLGKLLEAGFVEVLAPEAPEGRRGRPSQRYRATRREVAASMPPRDYALLAEVLLASAAEGVPPVDVARRRGAALAQEEPAGRRPRGRAAALSRLEALLARLGYAPRRDGHDVVLVNCPFDRLRDTNLELVCSINAGLAEGYLDGLGLGDVSSRLRPCPDACCVVFSPT